MAANDSDPEALQAAVTAPPAVEVSPAVHQDVSPPLALIPPAPDTGGGDPGSGNGRGHEHEMRLIPRPPKHGLPDPVVQDSAAVTVAATGILNFDGIGSGFSGPAGAFTVNSAPPDTNGAVGDTQYVQWVNESFAVFNKATGAPILGPVAGNTLWSGFGGGCEANNDGDPIVQYDKLAKRWILTQFSVTTTPFLQCVAVSATSDATGSYFRYAFQQPNFNDYPKASVWPDAYYVTYNIFGSSFQGGRVCAMDRAKMLTGAAATQVCFQLASSFGGLLVSDLDGTNPPPAGSPAFVANFGSNILNTWKFHVDFATPANSTLTGPTTIAVAAFTPACNGGGTCIPQPGTRQKLDSLADRLMHRFAYRNFADGHQALVVNHAVTANNTTGIRWYELRVVNGALSLFQQGTFAPDATSRWMGSIAMDKVGNIAVGYSTSSSTVNPGIRFTGRAPGDPAGTLQAESTIITGGGAQQTRLSRWGDYSAMTVDPVDDCTFWYTNEYLKANGTFNWSTRIASFKLAGCQ